MPAPLLINSLKVRVPQ